MPEDGVPEKDAVPVQALAPLPGRPEGGKGVLRQYLRVLIRHLDIEVPAESETSNWSHVAGNAVRVAFRGWPAGLSEDFFEPLIGAAVYETDPSFNRWFVEPAINAFGRRRVRMALLTVLRTGTNRERAGSARAWYWTAYPLKQQHLRSGTPAETLGAEADEGADVVAAWRETSLREFVRNEHLDVRRCILPQLRLNPASYPPELHTLVDAAVAIARSHPDEYIRHRVEIQVHQ
jgi:hypothetical protein